VLSNSNVFFAFGRYPFCTQGQWTVDRYSTYILRVHETVMTPAPANPATDPLPAGKPMDVFLDDHISW
jgi:hypothetical protein